MPVRIRRCSVHDTLVLVTASFSRPWLFAYWSMPNEGLAMGTCWSRLRAFPTVPWPCSWGVFVRGWDFCWCVGGGIIWPDAGYAEFTERTDSEYLTPPIAKWLPSVSAQIWNFYDGHVVGLSYHSLSGRPWSPTEPFMSYSYQWMGLYTE